MSKFPPTYLKAVVAFISTTLAQLGVLMAGGGTFGQITDGQWVALASATLAATAAVYGLGNGKDADPTTSTPALGVDGLHDPNGTDV